jgi:lipoyl(octanoyl) transferase
VPSRRARNERFRRRSELFEVMDAPATTANESRRILEVRRLGRVPYGEAAELQKQLVEERRTGVVPDTLLLLEHPHVVTRGVKAKQVTANLRVTEDELTTRHVELIDSGRGGDITYHGPGQLVGYPILDLRPDRCSVHGYVHDLEEVIIRVARDFGVEAERIEKLSGVWVGDRKLAAIGIRISRWITSHGFALNVGTDLSFFDLIVPCGITGKSVTSLAQLLGHTPPMEDVETRVVTRFAEVFGAIEPAY